MFWKTSLDSLSTWLRFTQHLIADNLVPSQYRIADLKIQTLQGRRENFLKQKALQILVPCKGVLHK